ncbi:MAG: hypothetical protein VKJ44_03420 [Synechococcus sp.]|nr:hypothetical protein [Synechococcus sp.]
MPDHALIDLVAGATPAVVTSMAIRVATDAATAPVICMAFCTAFRTVVSAAVILSPRWEAQG